MAKKQQTRGTSRLNAPRSIGAAGLPGTGTGKGAAPAVPGSRRQQLGHGNNTPGLAHDNSHMPRAKVSGSAQNSDIGVATPPASHSIGEYDFLIGELITRDMLAMAQATAWYWGVSPHEALIALGWISEEDYVAALAKLLGLGVIVTEIRLAPLASPDEDHPFPGLVRAAMSDKRDTQFFALDGLSQTPSEIRVLLARSGLGSRHVVLVPRAVLRHGEEMARASSDLALAIGALRHATPHLSAGTPVWLWQALVVTMLVGFAIGGLMVAPLITSAVFTGVMAVLFLCIVVLRSLALFAGAGHSQPESGLQHAQELHESQLPNYSILVPLYRENEILPDLVQALQNLDYPAAKLEIFLVLESVDRQMQRALAAMTLPPQFRVVVVPDAMPRTKPKALNYALQLARGDYVVVYDAEDVPQRDQLRRAVDSFQNGPTNLGCVQARLNIYNPKDSWLSRQFTIEYTALFDAILPTLQRFNIPVPLGGTSNHLPRKLLVDIGGWDPFNVTEDADLGIRLARAGYVTHVLASTTWEEAPSRLTVWTMQRTRWLKGWMQTYLVHSRRPLVLLRELGARQFLGFHILMGGILVSTLVHPLFYVLVAVDLAYGRFLSVPEAVLPRVLWGVAGFNLVLGYLSAMALGAVAVKRRKQLWLMIHVLLMPVYWLLISFAAYRALWQFIRAPYKWEKTEHHSRDARATIDLGEQQ